MILTVVNILALFLSVKFFKERYGSGQIVKLFVPALLLKLGSGFVLGLIYLFYYEGGDTYTHFEQAKLLGSHAFQDLSLFTDIFFKSDYSSISGFTYTIQPQSAFFCKVIAIFNVLTGSNYWLTGLWFSLFSFMGFWHLARVTHSKIGGLPVLLVLFFPSLAFWTSGILKETLAVGAMAWIIAIIWNTRWTKTPIRIVPYILLLILVIQLKYYFGGLMAAFSVAYIVFSLIPVAKINLRYQSLIFLAMMMLSLLLFSRLHPNLYGERIAQVIADNYQAYAKISDPSKMLSFKNLDGSISSILINVPKAFILGIFSPLWGTNGFLWIINVVENWLLLIMSLAAIGYQLKHKKLIFSRPAVVAVAFVFIMATLLALTAPNIGTLVRYKSGFMPVFLLLVGSGLNYRERINSLMSRILP